MNTIRWAVAVGATSVLLACGGGGGGGGAVGAEPSSDMTIVFENRQFSDCTVYYEGSAGRRRLGRVEGNTTLRFRVPHSPTGFRITASYTAIGDFSTQEILADPGNMVTVTSHSTGNLTFSISG